MWLHVSNVSGRGAVRCGSQAHDVLRVSGCAYGALVVAALAMKGERTWNMGSRHRSGAVRASTLLTCWHGQETTVAPRSNVACPSTISVWGMAEEADYCIEVAVKQCT